MTSIYFEPYKVCVRHYSKISRAGNVRRNKLVGDHIILLVESRGEM